MTKLVMILFMLPLAHQPVTADVHSCNMPSSLAIGLAPSFLLGYEFFSKSFVNKFYGQTHSVPQDFFPNTAPYLFFFSSAAILDP